MIILILFALLTIYPVGACRKSVKKMATYINFRDPNSKEIETLLNSLEKTPGVCIFIDVIDSTLIKYQNTLAQWGRKLNNTFNFISFLNDFKENIVKGIGDQLMVYISDSQIKKKNTYNNYYSLLEDVYSTIYNLKNFPEADVFHKCKVGIHYCEDVYNITFFKECNDFYGRDIDLTARLMSKTKPNRIVMTETFYKKALNDYGEKDYQASMCLSSVSEKYIEDFKGIPGPTEFRVIDV
ncbi:MAG: hypothetical protein C0614_10700 [Desulfuromonas sp.]|nr:MAG: hypothetical protein C0614_10700 [Desulfuromonas sp.]